MQCLGKLIKFSHFIVAAAIVVGLIVVVFGIRRGHEGKARSGIVQAILIEAVEAEQKGLLPQAISAYEKILAQDQGFTLAYLKLGMIYFHLGLPSKAEEVYLKAIEKGLSDPDVYLYLGYIKESQGNFDQALDYYRKGEFTASRNPVLYFNMGNVYVRLDQKDKAVVYFKRAFAIKPDYVDAVVNLSIILAQTGDYADARYYLDKAEKLGYQTPADFKDGLNKLK